MAKTLSTMLPLGTRAAHFSLPDVVTGDQVRLGDFKDRKALLVMFLSRHCPFVKHIQSRLAEVGNDYQARGVGVVAICSNDVSTHPDDGPDGLRDMAAELGFEFPFLYDESQDVARAYVAACTPDLFLFDEQQALVYRGQFDDSRPGNEEPVTGNDLKAALDAVLAGRQVSANQRPSVGCNIKWRSREATLRGGD